MIRTYLELDLKPGASNDLVELFRQRRILEQAVSQPGCRSSELTLAPDGTTAIVTATWDNHEAYQRWSSDPWRQSISSELNQLLATPLAANAGGGQYLIAHCADSPEPSPETEEI